MSSRYLVRIVVMSLVSLACACQGAAPASDAGKLKGEASAVVITLGAYTTPREVYGQSIIPAFTKLWQEQHNQAVRFEQSYVGSGAQARAIIGGFEADVAALSLEPDIQKLVQAGLVSSGWKQGAQAGMVSRSVVVIGVRPGNPKGIASWEDLAKPGLAVLTPNVRTSGGAMWNLAAIYGATLRGKTSVPANDPLAAAAFLTKVLANVVVMDKGARESMLSFERGIGDAIITYENEIKAAQRAGKQYDYLIPRSTLLIENPVAVVERYAKAHGSLAAAEAFVAFLASDTAQRAFAEHGFRPVNQAVAAANAAGFPPVEDLFTVADLGGWPALERDLFASGALYDKALQAVETARR